MIALDDPEILRGTMNRLSDRVAAEGFANDALPGELEQIVGFEDCAWLFSSNVVNHFAARLMINEAAHLFGLIRMFDRTPRVVEIGRFRGGTTLLMAAAGADVLSIDIDEQLRESDQSLRLALSRLGLGGLVRLATADSSTFPIDAGSVDLLFIDGDHSYEGASRDVSHWLPSLRPGGILVLHDATRAEPSRPWNRPSDSETLGVRQLAGELRSRTDFDEMTAPGTLAQFRYAGSGESVAG